MVRTGQQAGVVLAEQPIAIQRDAVIRPVSQASGQDAQQAQRLPAGWQLADHFKERIGTFPIMPVANHRHGVELVHRQPGPRQQRLAFGGLHGGQADTSLVIVANQETRPAVAEFADTVEQNHSFAGFEEWRGGRAGAWAWHRVRSNGGLMCCDYSRRALSVSASLFWLAVYACTFHIQIVVARSGNHT